MDLAIILMLAFISIQLSIVIALLTDRKEKTDYISKEDAIDCVLSQYCASSDETEEALGDAIDAIKALPAERRY